MKSHQIIILKEFLFSAGDKRTCDKPFHLLFINFILISDQNEHV